jgi:hypothetical protein
MLFRQIIVFDLSLHVIITFTHVRDIVWHEAFPPSLNRKKQAKRGKHPQQKTTKNKQQLPFLPSLPQQQQQKTPKTGAQKKN